MNAAAAAPDQGARLARAAEALLGCPFRLHGRDPASGLDCVGLVAAAMTDSGLTPLAPTGYGLRNLTIGQWLVFAQRSGLTRASGPVWPGDILLLRLGPCQHHLMVAIDAGTVIHAHAGLRRAVRQPLECGWQITARWRIAPDHKG